MRREKGGYEQWRGIKLQFWDWWDSLGESTRLPLVACQGKYISFQSKSRPLKIFPALFGQMFIRILTCTILLDRRDERVPFWWFKVHGLLHRGCDPLCARRAITKALQGVFQRVRSKATTEGNILRWCLTHADVDPDIINKEGPESAGGQETWVQGNNDGAAEL